GGHEPDGRGLGGSPDRDDRRLRPQQPRADSPARRAELPDRAPPVPSGLSRPLPRAVADRGADVPRVRGPVRRPPEFRRRDRVALPVAQAAGPARPEAGNVTHQRLRRSAGALRRKRRTGRRQSFTGFFSTFFSLTRLKSSWMLSGSTVTSSSS